MKPEIAFAFSFTEEEKESLYAACRAIKLHPYRQYNAFHSRVAELARDETVAPAFFSFMRAARERDPVQQPFLFIENCPIDKILPVFDFVDPVNSKHFLKKSYVSEAFLSLFATLDGTHPIGYLNVNGGDVFQDIYPMESMKKSQSQKTLGEINFHKDLANHFVRPDFVNILSLRSSPKNETLTVFVRNVDVLENISEQALAALRKKDFYTPFDDLTLHSNNTVLGEASKHAVFEGIDDLRYFEKRTIGLTDEGRAAIAELDAILHRVKCAHLMRPGDFVAIHNNYSVHGKDLGAILDEEVLRTRWMMKTVNVAQTAPHTRHFVTGTDYLVNG